MPRRQCAGVQGGPTVPPRWCSNFAGPDGRCFDCRRHARRYDVPPPSNLEVTR